MPVGGGERGRRRGPRGDERPGVTPAGRAGELAGADRLPRQRRVRPCRSFDAWRPIPDVELVGRRHRSRAAGRAVAATDADAGRRTSPPSSDRPGPDARAASRRRPRSPTSSPSTRPRRARGLRPDRPARRCSTLPHGALNLHPSLLPRHRGATPIPATILAGDATTGVTLMRMDAGLDTGPIVGPGRMCRSSGTRPRPTSRRASRPSRRDAARPTSLGPWLRGEIQAAAAARTTARPDSAAAPRGRPPRPGPARDRARASGPRLPAVARVHSSRPPTVASSCCGRLRRGRPNAATPGAVVPDADGLALATATAVSALDEVQPAGGRRDDRGAAYLRGRPGPPVVGSRTARRDVWR